MHNFLEIIHTEVFQGDKKQLCVDDVGARMAKSKKKKK